MKTFTIKALLKHEIKFRNLLIFLLSHNKLFKKNLVKTILIHIFMKVYFMSIKLVLLKRLYSYYSLYSLLPLINSKGLSNNFNNRIWVQSNLISESLYTTISNSTIISKSSILTKNLKKNSFLNFLLKTNNDESNRKKIFLFNKQKKINNGTLRYSNSNLKKSYRIKENLILYNNLNNIDNFGTNDILGKIYSKVNNFIRYNYFKHILYDINYSKLNILKINKFINKRSYYLTFTFTEKNYYFTLLQHDKNCKLIQNTNKLNVIKTWTPRILRLATKRAKTKTKNKTIFESAKIVGLTLKRKFNIQSHDLSLVISSNLTITKNKKALLGLMQIGYFTDYPIINHQPLLYSKIKFLNIESHNGLRKKKIRRL